MDLGSPVVQCGSGVLTAPDFDHEQGEEQEEHGHAEADAVHSLIANQHITVHMPLHTRDGGAHPPFTETWNLQQHRAGLAFMTSYTNPPWNTGVSIMQRCGFSEKVSTD